MFGKPKIKAEEILEKLDNVNVYRPVIIKQLEIAVKKDFEKRGVKEIEIDDWTNQKWNNIIMDQGQMLALAHNKITIDDLRNTIIKVAKMKNITVMGV